MDAARKWLDQGNVLAQNARPDPSKLGAEAEIPWKSIDFLQQIQRALPPPTDLVAVAVDDMKVLTALMKLVVIYGISVNLAGSEMVALEPRVSQWPLPAQNRARSKANTAQLERLSAQLRLVLDKDDDVSRLILISPFLVDILALASHFPGDFDALAAKVPTFNLYRLLVQLRALPAPSPKVSETLATMPLYRKDAVRTLIELVIESKEGEAEADLDVASLNTAVIALASVPKVPAKTYIEAVGDQLFGILSISGPGAPKLVEATALIIEQISASQPKILGRLRNMIVNPLLQPQLDVENSLGALLQLSKFTRAPADAFTAHVASRVLLSLWLLVGTMGDAGSIEGSILAVLSECMEHTAQLAPTLVGNLLIRSLPGNLEWIIEPNKPPVLAETVKAPTEDESMLKQIERRMSSFMLAVRGVSDSTATRILVALLRNYAAKNPDQSPVAKLLVAKAVESLAQNAEIKPKLFSDPYEIIEFVFTLVSARVSRFKARDSAPEPSNKLRDLSLADSDDEDEPEPSANAANGGNGGAEAEDEDNDLLEIGLSLLGSALMEAAADDDENKTVSQEQKDELRLLAGSEQFPKTIRARADFCVELLDGSARSSKEVDMNDSEAVLRAAHEALREPLVPSRAYGLHLISTLVARRDLDLNTAIEIFGHELGDDDSYIYLNAIKGIENAASSNSTAKVVELLLPLLEGDADEQNLDKTLRAREALIRILTPGSVDQVGGNLIELLMQDLRAAARGIRDVRLRLSSASMLGIVIAQFPLSVVPRLQSELTDCALGILRHEKEDNNIALQRAAVVLSLEIVNAVNEGSFTNVAGQTLNSLVLEIREVMQGSDDDTLKDQSAAVLSQLEN